MQNPSALFIWSREEDMQHDIYRAATAAQDHGADRCSRPVESHQPSISLAGNPYVYPAAFTDNYDASCLEGLLESWSDTQVVAAVSAGASLGMAQL